MLSRTGREISAYWLLRGIGAIYCIAFASLFLQLPALYGCDGLQPVTTFLNAALAQISGQTPGKAANLTRLMLQRPTLLWLALPGSQQLVGLAMDHIMDLLCLAGLLLGGLIASGYVWGGALAMAYVLYLSFFSVGQTFLSFQWDILLLEFGTLAIFLAPYDPCHSWSPFLARRKTDEDGAEGAATARKQTDKAKKDAEKSSIGRRDGEEERGRDEWFGGQVLATPVLLLIQLLLFKLMFLSGVVKIANGGHWYQMTAMYYHHATTCLPGPLAYYAHQLPALLHEMEVGMTLIVEIFCPLLLILPVPRSWRIFGSLLQIGLQVVIQMTGNYTFFNMLTALMCISVLDNGFWADIGCYGHAVSAKKETRGWRLPTYLSLAGLLLGLCILWGNFVRVDISSITKEGILQTKEILSGRVLVLPTALLESLHFRLNFSLRQLHVVLARFVPLLLVVIAAIVVVSVCLFLYRLLSTTRHRSLPRNLANGVAAVLIVAFVVLVVFGNVANYTRLLGQNAGTVPHNCGEEVSLRCIAPKMNSYFRAYPFPQANGALAPWAAGSSYGLFRSMTGVGGAKQVARPELVIEGFNGTLWLPYSFRYKPGDVNRRPATVAPHQPRLDWQMWFAALGTYERNPWLIHWVYKLLIHSPTARDLIDASSPFREGPPEQIRVTKYEYDFARDEVAKIFDEKHRRWDGGDVEEGEWWRRRKIGEWLPAIDRKEKGVLSYLKGQALPLDPASECKEIVLTSKMASDANYPLWLRALAVVRENDRTVLLGLLSAILAAVLARFFLSR